MKLSKAVRAEFAKQGARGGHSRAAKLSKAQRVAIAKLGASKRWDKKKDHAA